MLRAAYHKTEPRYPTRLPFDPPVVFPELHAVTTPTQVDPENLVYPAVRDVLSRLELDFPRRTSSDWNPLRELVGEGKHVVIKPNLVTHQHHKGPVGLEWSLTHPSVIRALIDYALLAVGPSGKVTVADVPIENCDFDALCEATRLRRMIDTLRARGHENVTLLDLRTYRTRSYPDGSSERYELPGDPAGYTDIDLGEASCFHELERRRGAQNYYTLGDHSVDHFDPKTRQSGMPNQFHRPGRHVYHVANTILAADLVLSVAKLKTHKFSGVTLCLKNAIGISQGKEFLPHRRPGLPEEGGDSFPRYPSKRFLWPIRAKRRLFAFMGGRRVEFIRQLVRRFVPPPAPHRQQTEPLFGNWSGNDTIWRTTLDLNVILSFADRAGRVGEIPARRYLGVIDGIVGMDHEAPMEGLPVYAGVLIAARDGVAADALGAVLMGFDPARIPTIARCISLSTCRLGDPGLSASQLAGNTPIEDARSEFVPARGWENLACTRRSRWP